MTRCRLSAFAGGLCVAILASVGAGRALALAPVADPPLVQDLKGTLTGTGQITINDTAAQSGASVANGSLVATGPDGDASLDLGVLGRLQLRPNTTIRLALAPNHCALEMLKCGSLTEFVPSGVAAEVKVLPSQVMQVATLLGAARVNHSGGKDGTDNLLVKAGENRTLDKLQTVTASGQATFTINCCDCEIAGAKGGFFIGPGLAGLLALVGIGAAVVAGVAVGGEPRQRLSAVR